MDCNIVLCFIIRCLGVFIWKENPRNIQFGLWLDEQLHEKQLLSTSAGLGQILTRIFYHKVIGVTTVGIFEETKIPHQSNEFILELLRDVHFNFERFISDLKLTILGKAQLGLANSYIRAMVKFSVNRVDIMVIQVISILDILVKDVNSMRIRMLIRPIQDFKFKHVSIMISCAPASGEGAQRENSEIAVVFRFKDSSSWVTLFELKSRDRP
ncbi:hypothetical protein C5167_045903 [Papaver somniferum]|uniref:Uncharacterized protein n=1 Tax=Papaver somniferum TaxID=3469 RepID=A0A4Y7LD18_PAPSO|nr:hypothetical protein C5167_045903 [Papaver somniferum]